MPPRYLTRNHATRVPSNLLFFDTESKSKPTPEATEHSLRLWCASACRLEDGRRTRRSEAQGRFFLEFWGYVDERLDKRRPLWCFAHNLGFDLALLDFWTLCAAGEFQLQQRIGRRDPDDDLPARYRPGLLILQRRPAAIQCWRRGCQVWFIDSLNYWDCPLATLGEALGKPKLELPDPWYADVKLFLYCRRDVEILEDSIVKLLTEWQANDRGNWRLSSSGLALSNYRHTCPLTSPDGDRLAILVDPAAPETETERQGYYGSRFEPFFLGSKRGEFYSIDCNGLFPAVMRDYRFPASREATVNNPPVDWLQRQLGALGAMAAVLVKTDSPDYPIRRNGVLTWPVGMFWTILCGEELTHALHHDRVVAVEWAITYRMKPLFRQWVESWWDERLRALERGEDGKLWAKFCKTLLTSLYGKWAQKNEHWEIVPGRRHARAWEQWHELDRVTGEPVAHRSIAHTVQRRLTDREPGHAFPAISAFIAAAARRRMDAWRAALPSRSVLYQGCDQWIISAEGLKAAELAGWIHPTELGRFKVERVAEEVDIRGPNFYRFGATWVRAGLFGRAFRVDTAEWAAEVWDGIGLAGTCDPCGVVRVRQQVLDQYHPSPKSDRGDDGWCRPYVLTVPETRPTPLPVARFGS